MPFRTQLFRVAAALICPILGALALAPGISAVGTRGEPRCEYVAAGPPGPKGNRLVVVEDGDWLSRKGERIVVHEGFLPCTGRKATVHNIDQIVLKNEEEVTLGERGGVFGPGATHERSGSGIEITVIADRLTILGQKAADAILAKTVAGDAVALDLNANQERRAPDFDVHLRAEGHNSLPRLIRIDGRGGDDLIDVRALTGMGDNEYLRSRIRLSGGRGSDTIIGSPGDEYRLQDGPGNDLVRAGGGNDEVELGSGRDAIYGGEGDDDLYYGYGLEAGGGHRDAPDRLFGGPGGDVIQDDNGHADVIRCGPGDDLLDAHGPDRGSDCEKVRRGRGDLL